MRILYVASRTPETESLALEKEITDVQRQVGEATTTLIRSVFLPDMTIEDLPGTLSKLKPDVLHVSVHGETDGLSFATAHFEGKPRRIVPVTGRQLASFLDPRHPPKLVFLNACNSRETARELAECGIVAIGTGAPITNQAAIAASRILYERLLGGWTVAQAFEAADNLVQCMEQGRTSLHLFSPTGARPDELILNALPRVAARLTPDAVIRNDGAVPVNIGVIGFPPDTVQVVFFTADPSFDADADNREEHMSEIVRDAPRRNGYWTEQWTPCGDFLVAACGITNGGVTFSVSAMLTQALREFADHSSPPKRYRDLLEQAVAVLRRNDGGGLEGYEEEDLEKNPDAVGSGTGSSGKKKKARDAQSPDEKKTRRNGVGKPRRRSSRTTEEEEEEG